MNAATPNTIIFANRNVITYSNTLWQICTQQPDDLLILRYVITGRMPKKKIKLLSLEQNGRLADFAGYDVKLEFYS
jgi:hypothetical protein